MVVLIFRVISEEMSLATFLVALTRFPFFHYFLCFDMVSLPSSCVDIDDSFPNSISRIISAITQKTF